MSHPHVAEWATTELAKLREAGLLRRSDEVPAAGLDGWSNDYLGLGACPPGPELLARITAAPTSGRASRLIFGGAEVHSALERALAAWVDQPVALVFSTGYAANVGVLSALAGEGDLIVSDALNHASLIDGCRLSRAEVVIVPHLSDPRGALSRPARRRFLVTESYFSMDGDSPDLAELRRVASEAGALLVVDEAHALGVYGPRGAGLCAASGLRADLVIGTLGKALGAEGAFVACSAALRELLWNRARSFVFSTAPSPVTATIALSRLRDVIEGDRLRETLAARVAELDRALGSAWPRPPGSHGPIRPLLAGSPANALALERSLGAAGVVTRAIRPPTVPAGTSRVRLTVKATWSPADVARVAAAALAQR